MRDMDDLIQFDHYRSNRSRDNRNAHFVMEDDERLRTVPAIIGRTPYGVLHNGVNVISIGHISDSPKRRLTSRPTIWWGRA